MIEGFKEIPLGNASDLSKEKFGRLTPLYRTENISGRTAWLCQCDCGNYKVVSASNLKQHNVNSCGCFQKEQASKTNSANIQPGQKFNRLTVIEKANHIKMSPNDRSIYWKCKCDCGKITEVPSKYLISGHTKSCGCLAKELLIQRVSYDLTNQHFGLLTALEVDQEKTKNTGRRYWKCQCDCGNTKSIQSNHLLSGETISCGCYHESLGVLKIKELLKQLNYNFIQEQTFDDCRNPKTNKLFYFDFYVENKYLIEYDGEQHFYQVANWEPLDKIQFRDQCKNDWCKKNNIPLIRIPYTKLKTLNIDDLKIDTTKYLI